MKHQRWLFGFLVLFIFLFAIITKVRHLGQTSFDFDEIYSLNQANFSYAALLTGGRYDPGNPPFYFVILRAWKSLVGENEFRLRLLSVLFHLAALGALFFQAKNRLKPATVLVIMLLLTGSGVIFFLSRYVRAYSLVILLALVVFSRLLSWLAKRKFSWVEFGLAYLLCLLGLYVHYSFIVYYLFLFLTFLFIFRGSKERLIRLFSFSVFLILGYLPWAALFLSNQVAPVVSWQKYGFWQAERRWVGFEGWLSVFTNGLSRNFPSVQAQVVLAVLLLLIFDFFLVRRYRKERNLWKKSVLVFLFLSLNGLMLTPLHRVFNDPRYSIYLLPFAFLGLGILVDSFKNRFTRAVLLVFLIPYAWLTYSSYQPATPEKWRELSQAIPWEKAESVILFHPCSIAFSLNYYYRGNLPQYCFFENPMGMWLEVWNRGLQKKIYLVVNWGLWELWEKEGFPSDERLFQTLIHDYWAEKQRFANIELVILRKK